MTLGDRVTIIETSMDLQLTNLDKKMSSVLESQKEITNEMQNLKTRGCFSLNELRKNVVSNSNWIDGNGKEGAKVKIAQLVKNAKWTNRLLIGIFLAMISLILKSFV